ncbi:MAG: sulfurtransferase TusA family protein [Gammaproteobacteria bacterium]|nr:sulfurtransferase TusA family protein [Gammaproteobacteria bacterium]
MAQHILDATELNCPMPILKAKQALAKMDAKETLEVTCTDKGSTKDFIAFCHQTGNTLLSYEEKDGRFIFNIEKIA